MSLALDGQRWEQGVAHLQAVEPGLGELFERFPGEAIQGSGQPFQVLANSIVGQQISVKAASAIFERVGALMGEWSPGAVDRVTDEQLRTAGLSVRKVEYFRSLALAFQERRVRPDLWDDLPDPEVHKELIALRGIGRWTAEMVLIFLLRRPDVLPLDDIGLLKAAARQFGWDYPFDPKVLAARAEVWRPWRTIGTWYLWRALDPHPVFY